MTRAALGTAICWAARFDVNSLTVRWFTSSYRDVLKEFASNRDPTLKIINHRATAIVALEIDSQ